jgi:predicted DNA-binding protein
MKDVTLTIRIEETLRDQFTVIASRVGRPAAQIIRELMREFVIRAQTPSEQDLVERRMAVDFARANTELEGFSISEDFAEALEKLARGEINIDDIHRQTEEKFAHLRVTPGER